MTEAVHGKGAPFLGICVGMQLLATRGLEFGETPGLDWIAGDVTRLRARRPAPSRSRTWAGTAWTDVADHPLFDGGPERRADSLFHPLLRLFPERRAPTWRPMCDHGGRFAAAVARGQCGRRAVPPREVAGRRASTFSRTSWSGDRDPLPGHRPEGRPVRARGARRPGDRDGVQHLARRPGAASGPTAASTGSTSST